MATKEGILLAVSRFLDYSDTLKAEAEEYLGESIMYDSVDIRRTILFISNNLIEEADRIDRREREGHEQGDGGVAEGREKEEA